MNVWEIKQAALELDVNPKIAIKMRIRYLQEQLIKNDECIETGVPAEVCREDVLRELESYEKALKYIDRPPLGSITDEMIEKARSVPVETLIEFTKGKALAWCHEDRSPSLTHYRKGNRATCWPCGKSYNPIDILVERDKMNFVDAVKYLCS
jgi:hypothetical protein